MAVAFINNRLCLLGDFDKHIRSDSSLTVSRYETTGSDFYQHHDIRQSNNFQIPSKECKHGPLPNPLDRFLNEAHQHQQQCVLHSLQCYTMHRVVNKVIEKQNQTISLPVP